MYKIEFLFFKFKDFYKYKTMSVKHVSFSNFVDIKEDDNIIKDKCKDYDGSLKIKQDMIFATFCIEFLEKRNIKTVIEAIDKLEELGITNNNIPQFIDFCQIEMNIILNKLVEFQDVKEDIYTNLEIDEFWDKPSFIEAAKNRSKYGVSLLRHCSRDASKLGVKFTVEWVPFIRKFLIFLQHINEYCNN